MARYDSQRAEGTPFGTIFWAVFLALTAYGLLEALVKLWIAKAAIEEVARSIPPVTAPARQSPQSQAYATAYELPLYLGPIAARREGAKRACINGLTSLRVEGGWNQTGDPCRQSQE